MKKFAIFFLIIISSLLATSCAPKVGIDPTYDLEKDIVIYLDEQQNILWVGENMPEIETGDLVVYIKNVTNEPITIWADSSQEQGVVRISYPGYSASSPKVTILSQEIKPLTISINYNPLFGPAYPTVYFLAEYESSGEYNWGLGILIGTGTIWLLTLCVVSPITKRAYLKRVSTINIVNYTEEEITEIANKEYTKAFITTDVIVLGIAGLVMGTSVGWYFIGISFSWRHWPGLITFILASLVGTTIHGAIL